MLKDRPTFPGVTPLTNPAKTRNIYEYISMYIDMSTHTSIYIEKKCRELENK